MIKFSDLKKVISLLQQIKCETTNEKYSAIECVKLQQTSSKSTQFTTMEPASGVFSKTYLETDTNSFGDDGEEYLISCSELLSNLQALEKAKANDVTLEYNGGQLLAYTRVRAKPDVTVIKSIKESCNFTDCRTLRLYAGESEDFKVPDFQDPVLIGLIKVDRLDLLVSMLSNQFSGSEEKYVNTIASRGRTIRLEVTQNYLRFFCPDKDLQVNLDFTIGISLNEELEELPGPFYIEGRHLSRLKDLATDSSLISLYTCTADEINWLCFDGPCGHTYVRYLDSDITTERKYAEYEQASSLINSQEPLIPDQPDGPKRMDLNSVLSCSGMALSNAFKAQHTEANKLQEELVLAEDKGVISIFDLQKAMMHDQSRVPIEDFSGEWHDVVVHYKYIEAALTALKSFSFDQAYTFTIEITQVPHVIGEDMEVLLMFLTIANSGGEPNLRVYFLSRPAADKLQEETT